MDNKETKITYMGAGGKIGKQAISMICSKIPDNENVEIVLIGSGTNESLTRLGGFVKDVQGRLELEGKNNNIKFTITNDYSQTNGSDIVICSAGRWATKKEDESFRKIDPSGRLIQSAVNGNMIRDITKKLETYCPEALLFIATNQVDMMCNIARESAPKMNIIGLTGAVDSTRLKQVLKEKTELQRVEGTMVGFHNGSMTPLINSIKNGQGELLFPLLSKEVEQNEFASAERQQPIQSELERQQEMFNSILSTTKTLGGKISSDQRTGLTSGEDTGASILPATAITRFISAYCFGINTHTESYNTFIIDPNIAHHYGIEVGTALSIPMIVSKGQIRQTAEIPLLESEKLAMREAQKQLRNDFEIIQKVDVKTL